MQCHEVDYEIHGDDMQMVEVELDPGEKVIAEAGAMNYMEQGIGFEARMGDGSAAQEGFFGTLNRLGVDVVGQIAFDDHVDYTPKLAERISHQADAHEADILITTQKDAVKLSGLSFARPVFQLAVTINVTYGGDELLAAIAAVAPPVATDEAE